MDRRLLAGLEAVRDLAVQTPGQPALFAPDGQVRSYHDLWSDLQAVRARLLDASISEDATVAILAPQGLLQVVATMGVLAHCTCAPLQPRTTLAEVREALDRFGAVALVVAPEFSSEAEAALAMGLVVLRADAQISPEEWPIDEPKSRCVPLHVGPPGTIMLLTTSATTGRAKIVPLTTDDINASVAARHRLLQLTDADRLLLLTSLCHLLGIQNVLTQWLSGGSIIASCGFDPERYSQWMRALQPTWYSCSPTVHQAALARLESVPLSPPSALRFVQSAGAPLPQQARARLEMLLGVPVWNDYGMTEASPIASDAPLLGDCVDGSAGRSYGVEIGILNASGCLLPPGENGEIVVRGPGVFSGYADDPEASRAAFHGDWFRTGDAGYLDREGNLFIIGRIKEMINRGGEKIAPSEVDEALAVHPAVLEAAAFAVPNPTLGEAVACAVVLRPGYPPVSAVELRRFAAGRLAPFKVPHRIYFVDSIPRGELGKPQRLQLAAALSTIYSRMPEPQEVSVRRLAYDVDDVFYKIHEIWARLLDRNDLGFDEDFFEGGGDSLMAIQMLAEVDERFGSTTSERAADFLDRPTLERLTELVGKPHFAIESRSNSKAMQVFPVSAGVAERTLFCVPADKEEGLYFRRLATHLHGVLNLSIVRPGNTVHRIDLFTFEHAGMEMAEELRRIQPEGPYFIAGYCYGGIVAAESARLLSKLGNDVRLVLFDVPMPGYLPLAGYWARWWRRSKREWRQSSAEHARTPGPKHSLLRRRLAWGKAIMSVLARRIAWSAVTAIRPLFAPLQTQPLVAPLLNWVRQDNLPFYSNRPLQMPILHILCTDEQNEMLDAARFGWRDVARGGIVEHFVPLDHSNVLHESNLPSIVKMIEEWGALPTLPPDN